MKMKKIFSIIISICMMVNFATFSFAEGELVVNKKINGNKITVSGYGKKVNIFLLEPGKTVEDLNNAKTDEELDEVANYCNLIKTKRTNKYSDTFKIMNADEKNTYKLYIKDGDREYLTDVRLSAKIYVSADGNEDGDGSFENPYNSIEKARDYLSENIVGGDVEVILKGGEYKIHDDIFFDSSNSGTKDFSITYKAAEGEKVVLSGTTKLDTSKIVKVTDETILNRVDERVRGKLVEIDLKEQGIPESIVDFDKKHTIGYKGKPMRLFLNGAEQDLARWPNAGYELISYTEGGGSYGDGNASLGGATIGIESLDSERVSRWQNAKDMYIEGYLKYGWHEEWAKVGSVDTEKARIKLNTYTQYGTEVGMRVAAVNLIEELDIAGEWYADSKNMKLYYYPPYDLTDADTLEIATLCDNFMTFSNASNINIEGIEFKCNADSPLYVTTNDNGGNGILIANSSSNINIVNCKLHDIGMDGIRINGNSDNVRVDGCVIYNTGYNGISVASGNRDIQESGNVVISNCHISDASRDSGSNGVAGVVINGGVGTVVENCLFNNMKNSAIRYSGNGHIIRNNEFYNCVNETTDAGAIYAGRSWSQYGTVIKNNYFHDIGAGLNYLMASAVFWDDNHSGNTFVGNIVNMNNKVSTGAVKIGGGRDNVVKGNIFLNSYNGIKGQDRTVTIPNSFDETNTGSLFNQTIFMSFKDAADIEGHPYYITADSWRDSYKTLYPKIMENFNDIVNNKKYSRANTYTDNVFYNCTAALSLDSRQRADSLQNNNQTIRDTGMFVNYNGGDFRLTNSTKSRYGFDEEMPDENFSMESIGIQKNYAIDDMDFELMYPENNSSFARNNTELKWNKVSQADSYTYQIATDKNFTNIVVEENTKNNVAMVTGLNLNTQYYWRVFANSISSRFGKSIMSDEVFGFNTSGEVNVWDISQSSETNNVKVIISNTKAGAESVDMIIAAKDKDGKLLAVRLETLDIGAYKTENISVGTEFENLKGISSIECYVWDSVETMKNIYDKKSFYNK